MPTRVTVALVFSYIVLGVESICLCCAGYFSIKEGENEPITFARGVATCCGCVFMLNVVWMLATAVGMQDSNIEIVESYAVINGCSDQYTHVPVDQIAPRINQSTANLKTASFLSYGLFAIYITACCVVVKQYKDEQ